MTESNGSSVSAGLNAISPPEVATLKVLEWTNIPTPAVFDFALEHAGNPVGVGCTLREKLSGKSLK
jgi:hypothetical protein